MILGSIFFLNINVLSFPDQKRKVCRICSSKVRTWCPDNLCKLDYASEIASNHSTRG